MAEIVEREDALFEQVSRLIDEARKQVRIAVNTAMVYTYYGVGKYIVEDEQQGHERAEYGKKVLKQLAAKLYYYISSSISQQYLEDNLAGSTNQKELYIGVLGDMRFPLPPLPEQHRIVAKIESLFSQLDLIEASL